MSGAILFPVPINLPVRWPKSLDRPIGPVFLLETLLKKTVKECILRLHTKLSPRIRPRQLLLPYPTLRLGRTVYMKLIWP